MTGTDHRSKPERKTASNTLQRKVVRELTMKALAGSQEVLKQFSRFLSELSMNEGLPPGFQAFLSLNGVCAGDIRELVLAAIEADRRLEAGKLTRNEAERLKARLDTKWEAIRLTAELISQAADQAPVRNSNPDTVGHA